MHVNFVYDNVRGVYDIVAVRDSYENLVETCIIYIIRKLVCNLIQFAKFNYVFTVNGFPRQYYNSYIYNIYNISNK